MLYEGPRFYVCGILTAAVYRVNPEFLPGKRALAIGLCVYHSIASTVLFQAPRFIPYSFGAFAERYAFLTPLPLFCDKAKSLIDRI
jgi:hypothetical protein